MFDLVVTLRAWNTVASYCEEVTERKKSAMRAHKLMNAAKQELLENLAPNMGIPTGASSEVVTVKRRSNNNVV